MLLNPLHRSLFLCSVHLQTDIILPKYDKNCKWVFNLKQYNRQEHERRFPTDSDSRAYCREVVFVLVGHSVVQLHSFMVAL